MIALTSVDSRREVDSVLSRLLRRKLSRCVRFTNRFTELVTGLRIPSFQRPETRLGPALPPPPNPTTAEPDGRRVLSKARRSRSRSDAKGALDRFRLA